LISTNFTLVVKKKLKAKKRRGGKAKKADEATEAPVAEADTTTDAAE
jgi:large subunit ribosomal protein L17